MTYDSTFGLKEKKKSQHNQINLYGLDWFELTFTVFNL